MTSLLAWLIRLFPAGFRHRFAGDMTEQIGRDYHRARQRGRWAAIRFVATTAADLVRSGLAERLRPTCPEPTTLDVKEPHNMLKTWIKDLGQATRALRRAPGFTGVAVVTLALAIGANVGIFSVVKTVLLDGLPFPEPDQLVYIGASAPGSDFPDEFGVGVEFYVQYREEADLLEDVAFYNSFTATLRVDDRVERVPMSMPGWSLFHTLGAAPVLGRLPEQDEAYQVALISHALWVNWFGADPNVIGKSFPMAGSPRMVIGVMGPEFRFPEDRVLLWVPADVQADDIVPGRFGNVLVGRKRAGVSDEALSRQLAGLAQRLPERFGGSAAYARLIEQHRPVVRPLKDELVGAVSGPLWVLLGSVAIVLLVACANVANLFMVRAEGRHRDLAVRRAIGASRGQLVRTQMAEAIVIAAVAGALAVALAWSVVPVLLRAAPPDIPRIGEVGVDVTSVAFTIGAALFTALLCGLGPALAASAPKMTRLRDGGRGSTQRRRWGRDALVVAQTALALVLLVGSGLLLRSFQALRNVDPGYETADIFTFQFAPEGDHLTDGPSWARLHTDFMHRLRALPGVASVGIVENVPLNEGVRRGRFRTESSDNPDGSLLGFTYSGGDYFATMDIAVRRGRGFTDADHTSTLGNAIVSQSAADLLWPGQNPIGQRLFNAQQEDWATVVGVVEDVKQDNLRDPGEPLVYYPLVGPTPTSWFLSSPGYVVKTTRAEYIAPEIRALVREVAPNAPMYRTFTMEGLASDSMVRLSFTMLTLGLASGLALVLGAIGLYGVLSYVVAHRTQEIGLRMALGARAEQVRRMVVTQGARVVLLGVAIGLAVALGTTRALSSLLYGVGAVDLMTFLGVSATMVLVGFGASYLPARRASNVDPIESLRGE